MHSNPVTSEAPIRELTQYSKVCFLALFRLSDSPSGKENFRIFTKLWSAGYGGEDARSVGESGG